ncbi:hypothetical protein AVEN_188584-1 [Araneus ventricosus]|uniref:F-box domain-containing protein n=1 Tax=Araneus ventricosus TaxID=182803 RepID=A0A4Y2HQR7_ARAVE|nr:hypothetical protein AVEN_188584-1 [Araneus ventricosus]
MAEWIQSNEREKYDKQVKWCDLPSPALEMIYSFVSREDQVNLSLVCRKWSEGFGSPSVWKTFRFTLTESQLSMEMCPVMKFVRKYSSMFRHLEIHLFILNEHLLYTWNRRFIEFLKLLTSNSQLISVKFQGLLWCFVDIDTPTYADIFRAIANFLGSQHHLKRVEFRQCLFGYQEGVKLLKNLTENTGGSLTHLVLRGFHRDEPQDEGQHSNRTQNLPTFVDLPSLTTLEIDYSFIFENMFTRQSAVIETSKNFQTRILLKIIIFVYDFIKVEGSQRLTTSDWTFLKQLYRNLQVEVNFETISPSRQRAEFFIVPYMPITQLNYDFTHYSFTHANHSSLMEIDALCNHLLACKTNDHLVSLGLKWVLPIPDLSSSLLPFLHACKKLKRFELFIASDNRIDVLLESLLENRPESLERVLLNFSGREDEDRTASMILATKYVPLLESVGLNLRVDFNFRKTII